MTIEIAAIGGNRLRISADIEKNTGLSKSQTLMLGLCVLAEMGLRETKEGTVTHAIFRRIEALVDDPDKFDH